MFTFFDLLMVLGALAGLAAGAVIGADFGIGFSVAGACIGILLGYLLGRAPWGLAALHMRRTLARASVQELRAQLDDRYFISHLIIGELVARGEPVESFRSTVAAQLESASSDVRRFGDANAKRWFPDLLHGS